VRKLIEREHKRLERLQKDRAKSQIILQITSTSSETERTEIEEMAISERNLKELPNPYIGYQPYAFSCHSYTKEQSTMCLNID